MGCAQSDTNVDHNAIQRRNTSNSKKKSHRKSCRHRLATKYQPQQVKQISDQQRRAGYTPVYTCPICFQYFNKILACTNCVNFICINCFQACEKKFGSRMKCSFCNSNTNLFADYQFEAHSYFDSSNKGFISKQQREKVDQQILKSLKVINKENNKKMGTIKEIEEP